jgi:hypothetical protein
MKVAYRLVRFLVRDRVSFQQVLPARRRNICDLLVRFGICQVGLGLPQLLIEFWSLDHSKKLALLNPSGDDDERVQP